MLREVATVVLLRGPNGTDASASERLALQRGQAANLLRLVREGRITVAGPAGSKTGG